MLKIGFSEYDDLCARLQRIRNDYPEWWPSLEEIEELIAIQQNDHISFMLWITLTADEPRSESDALSRKEVNKILYKNIIFLD